MHHASYPVFVHRPAALDWASSRPRLATTPLPFSLPPALRKPGHRTCTYEVTRHARRTRQGNEARYGGTRKNTYHLRLVCAIQNLERAQALTAQAANDAEPFERLAA